MRRRFSVPAIFVAVLIALLLGAGISGPLSAQSGAPATGNIAVSDGVNPGEVVISWDAVPQATHYRIGYVNMVQDYPLAKARGSKERIFESTFVMAIRQPRRGSGSPTRTPTDTKPNATRVQSNSETPVQRSLPIDSAARPEAASPPPTKPVAIRPNPRPHRRVNKKIQRPLQLNPTPDPQSDS